MDRLSQGYKAKGPWQKFGVVWQKMEFWAEIRVFGPKKRPLLDYSHVLATTRKSCANKKVPFSQIDISLLASSDTEILSSGLNGNVVALGILMICPVDKNPDSKTKIEFWSQYIILGQNCTFSFLRSFRPIGSPPVNVFNMKEVSHWFPDLRVPKILLLPSNNRIFGPKTVKFGPKLAFLAKYWHI